MTENVPILMYHSIANDATPKFRRWAVSPLQFRSHLTIVQLQGYTPLTVSDYVTRLNRRNLPDKQILITFDDGFEDFHSHALPTLKYFDIPATLYITTGYIGESSRWLSAVGEGERKMLSVKQIIDLAENGIEIGAHTITHPQLDTIPERQAAHEIVHSKLWLESVMGEKVNSFAYPHGYYNQTVRQIVIDAGFTSACGVKHALSYPRDDRFAMARIIVGNEVSAQSLKMLLAGEGLRAIPARETLKTKMWRMYRKQSIKLNLAGSTL